MNLTFNQADFLMHCIEVFAEGKETSFTDIYGNILLDTEEINELFLKIQELKFASTN